MERSLKNSNQVLYTSTSHIVVRFVGRDGLKLVKHIPWDSQKSVSCIIFDPAAQWLLLVLADLTLGGDIPKYQLFE